MHSRAHKRNSDQSILFPFDKAHQALKRVGRKLRICNYPFSSSQLVRIYGVASPGRWHTSAPWLSVIFYKILQIDAAFFERLVHVVALWLNMFSSPPSCRNDFYIAIVCALQLEYNAVCFIFNEFWNNEQKSYGKADEDPNYYTTDRVNYYNIILALLPYMGKMNAASAAASMRFSYCCLKLTLLVGVCGGVRTSAYEKILLGDVIVSE
jgi:hypothetical protein